MKKDSRENLFYYLNKDEYEGNTDMNFCFFYLTFNKLK